MSRTHKDVKREFRSPENNYEHGRVKLYYTHYYTDPYTNEDRSYTHYHYLEVAGAKTKKRRRLDTSWHWYRQTPSWWIRLFMNRPQRNRGKAWERKTKRMTWEQLEDTLPPDVSRKPHKYYW